MEKPKVIVDDSQFNGKLDPTQYSTEEHVIYVKSSYDVQSDPEGWMVHEYTHHKMRDVKDDGKEYPYNNIERFAYVAQFKHLASKGFSLDDIQDISKFPTLAPKFTKYNGEYAPVLIKYWNESNNIKENVMNLKESNELIMSLSHKHKISVAVLEQLWTEAISKQEESAKTSDEKDKGNPVFWKGVRTNFKKLIDNLEIQEAKAIMDSREIYTQSTSQWLDNLQNGDYSSAEKVFPEIIKSKLDVMINNGKEKYLKQLSDKVNQSKEA